MLSTGLHFASESTERRRLSALSPADHRRRQVDGNIERRDSRALPSGLLRCVAY